MPTPTQAALFGGGIDPDAQAWIGAVRSAGSGASLATISSVNSLVRKLKASGLWYKSYMIDACCGNDLTASLVRLKVPDGISRSYTNVNLVSGDYSETVGRTGDGSSKYLRSGINLSTAGWSSSSLMLWAYHRATVSAGTSRISIGATATGAGATALGWALTGSVEAVGIANTNANNSSEFGGRVSPSQTGFVGGGTNGSRVNQLYINGSIQATTGTATGSFNDAELFVLASNNSSSGGLSPAGYSNRPTTFVMITQGLSATECSTLNSLIQGFESAMGRNV